jgi:predicted enzyme related to lactoylglutathione lyase
MPNPVVHFEILAKDSKKAQDFYRQMFDWKIDADNPMGYGMVEPGEGGIGGGVGQTTLMVGHITFYVEVDDLDAYLKKVESLGGKTMLKPTAVPGGPSVALFVDPEGHLVGLTQKQ